MELVPLPPHSLRIGQVLTFSVRDAEGHLLFAAGQTLQNTPQVQALIQRGAWVQAHETKEYQKALVHKMDTLMMQGASLASIVKVEADFRADRTQKAVAELSEPAFWNDLHLHAHSLLKDPREDFLGRLETLREEALKRFHQRPDAVLTLLVHDASLDFQRYSARHAVLCLLVADLVAKQLGWNGDLSRALHNAALTMNLSITPQQDRLAAQEDKPSPRQSQEMRDHGDRSAEQLRALGVTDELWLGAVRLHHEAGPGPLAGRAAADQIARVLRRIDIFGARLSPRRNRKALSGAAAVRAIYLDERQQPDEAGAAVIKAVGLYPPGSLVRLANGEQGIVVRRGHSATDPLVAALIGKSGSPLSGPVPRDTRLQAQAVAASLAPHELKLVIHMEKLLKTTG